MADLIYCEFLKLKRTKLCLIAFLGTLVTPLLVLMITFKNLRSNVTVPLFGYYDSALVFLMPLFAPLILSIIAAYLFSREYTENTLKTIFAVPLSKRKFIAGKFITLLLCCLFFMLLTWAEILLLAILCNAIFAGPPLHYLTALESLIQMLYGAVLLYAAVAPVAYLSLRARGFFAPVMSAAVICLADVILTGSPLAPYFPWTSTYLLITGRIGNASPAAHLILATLCLASISASIHYFQKADIP